MFSDGYQRSTIQHVLLCTELFRFVYLINDELEKISPETWKKCCDRAMKFEKEFQETDGLCFGTGCDETYSADADFIILERE